MHLDARSRDLLEQVIKARGGQRPDLGGAADRSQLSDADVDALCEMLTDEFIATGLGPDDEPNERGLQLEQLLDAVNRGRVRGPRRR